MPRRSLLFLAHLLPYPPDSGAAIRTYNVLRQLSDTFDITALCFYRQGSESAGIGLAERVAMLSKVARTSAFGIPQDGNRWRLIWDHVRSLFSGRPYTYYMHESASYGRGLKKALTSTRYDIIHLDSLDLIRFLPHLPRELPCVCTHHNVESDLLRRRADLPEAPAILRAYLRHQSRLLAAIEREWLPTMALNIAVSEEDAARLSRIAPSARLAVIPNGVDTQEFRPRFAESTAGCVFVGGTNWFPNRDALEWFASDIAPLIREKAPDTLTTWVGHATDAERLRNAESDGLRLTGYVDDIRPYVHQASCFVVPLRVGGGTRLKVLDAWAMGKAVVSTARGCEGLAAVSGENILIADDAKGFAEAVVAILKDDALRRRLGAAGRQTAEAHYSWNALGVDLRRMYAEVLNSAA